MDICPCDSEKSYSNCCQKFHNGNPCKTTEELLRARFSAFVKHIPSYLIETHHPMYVNPQLISDLQDSSFLPHNLKILEINKGQEVDQDGSITYSFEYSVGTKKDKFTTTSLYSKMGNDWYYEKDT